MSGTRTNLARRARLPGACALLLMLSGCGEDLNRYSMLMMERVNGQVYLVLQHNPLASETGQSYFGVYERREDDPASFRTVLGDRSGPVFGSFAYRDAEGRERLGLLHEKQATLYEFTPEAPGVKVDLKILPYDWIPETGAQIGSTLYVFGGTRTGMLRKEGRAYLKIAAGSFEGGEFEDVKLESAPDILYGPFWIKALELGGTIHVFWREAQVYGSPFESIDFEPPLRFVGPLRRAVFDGKAFGETVSEFDLPQGYTAVWNEGTKLFAAVQPQSSEFGRCLPPRVYALGEANGVEEQALPERVEEKEIRFKFFLLERVPGEADWAFLRSNSQDFQLWRATPEGWTVRQPVAGLPVFGLANMLLGVLAGCVVTVAAGVGLALRRRRQVRHVLEQLKPADVLAPFSLRLSALIADLAVLVLATEMLTRAAGWEAPRWTSVAFDPLFILPPFFVLYVIYLGFCEWATGMTIGKWLLGLRVIDDRGERPTLYSCFVRNLVGYYERHPLLAPFAALPTMLLTPRQQRLGDLLAHTMVVQKAALDRYKDQRAKAQDEAAAQPKPAESKPE
ncbi:MAG: RDD family protein [Planctomycetota bacterium]|nr:RDD family protein [Planctomycetota bacterium]